MYRCKYLVTEAPNSVVLTPDTGSPYGKIGGFCGNWIAVNEDGNALSALATM